VHRREIPYVKIRRRVLFDPADLQTFIDAHKVPPRSGFGRQETP
jgi:hypothetical protein